MQTNLQSITNKLTERKYLIFISLAMFVFYNFIQLNIMNPLSMQLIDFFKFSEAKLGFISSLYFYTNLILLFFAGVILDLFSPKKVIFIVMGISLLSFGLFIFYPSLFNLILWRLTSGMACAFSITGSLKIISLYFQTNQRGLLIGLIGMTATFAGLMSQLPLTQSLQYLGFTNSLLIIFIFGFLAMVLLNSLVPNEIKKNVRESSVSSEIRNVFLNNKNWCAAILECLVNLPLFVLGALWGNIYLIKVYSLSNNIASIIVSMLFIGHMAGAPFFGFLADKINSRRMLLSIGVCLSVGSALVIYTLSYFYASLILLLILFFILGISTGLQCVVDAYVVGANKKSGVGKAISLLSIVSVGGGAVFQPLFGLIVQKNSGLISGYRGAIYILIFAAIIALFLIFTIPNKKNTSFEQSDLLQVKYD